MTSTNTPAARTRRRPPASVDPAPLPASGVLRLIDPAEFAALPLHERAGVYTRRSHADDDDRNASLVEQRGESMEAADELRVTVGIEFCEGEGIGASRHSRKARPVWAAALKSLQSGEISTLLVYELSRADRRGVFGTDLGALIERKHAGRIYVVDDRLDTADERDRDRLVRSIEDARREAEKTSRRVRRTKRRRRTAGLWLGGVPPLGLVSVKDDKGQSTGYLAHDPETYPLARRIADALLAGQSAHKIAADLNADGVPAPRSASWAAGTIATLARTPAWAGLASADSRKSESDGGWSSRKEPLMGEDGEPVPLGDGTHVITPDERARIMAAMSTRAEAKAMINGTIRLGGKRAPSSLLGGQDGILRCGHCGTRMDATGPRTGRFYRCANLDRTRCPGVTIPMAETDRMAAAWFMVALRLQAPGSPVLTAVAQRLARRLHPEADQARAAAQAAVEAAQADVDRITERVLLLPDAAQAAGMAALTKATDRLSAAKRALVRVPAVVADPIDLARRLNDWDSVLLSTQERRDLLAAAYVRLDVIKAGQGKRVPVTDRLVPVWHDAALIDADWRG
ncbi:recombinase family protein [Micromonospora tulbaghiae]|uniref:recombinase family protein n=1 Tax=Micromonospora tulbaghiae TaxID=479978 RepID=UPI003EB77B87